MSLLIIMLAISLNIDSFGVGISYGIRNIEIPTISKIILCLFSIIYSTLAIIFGKWLVVIFPSNIANIIGVSILLCMGIFIIYKNIFSNEVINEKDKINLQVNKPRSLNLHIKPLQLTIQIIKDPTCSDIDNSNNISAKEAFYLGIALSVDSLGAGIGSSAAGMSSFIIPLVIGIFQITFLTIGISIGKKLAIFSDLNKKICFIISGSLLILLAIIRLI